VPVPPPPLTLAVAAPAMVLPVGAPGWAYEKKVDGWRLAVHVPAGMLHSRRGADLTDRFPEVLAGARALGSVVLDGELVAYGAGGRIRFEPLYYGARRRNTAGFRLVYVAFDLLAFRGRDIRDRPYRDRRARLEAVLDAHPGGIVQLVTTTEDPELAARWISAEHAAVGIEGVVGKPLTSRYPKHRPGRAGWIKVRYFDTTDAEVLGVLGTAAAPTTLVLGQADQDGVMHAVGLSAPLSRAARTTLAGRLHPLPGTRRAAGIVGGLPGGADFEYTPVQAGVVVEVRADSAREWGRFRHRLTVITRAKAP
jgi:ATP-dependent DNA ligase